MWSLSERSGHQRLARAPLAPGWDHDGIVEAVVDDARPVGWSEVAGGAHSQKMVFSPLALRAKAGRASNQIDQEAIMRVASILSIIIVSLSVPALADDAELKKEMDQMNASFMESFNKHDAAGIAANFATNAIAVNQFGPHPNITEYYEGIFKLGTLQEETTVDQVWPLGSDTALGMGTFRITGNLQNGAAVNSSGFWTATYVREGGKWKVRMLSGISKPPPAK
jgi:ketosteroid isomerase-like protein